MKKQPTSVVHRPLFSWIWSGNVRLQVGLLLAVLVAVVARVVPLEMQKRIVDDAIENRSFDLLVDYCGIYLVAFVAASGTKYLINILQTMISQRTLAVMRKDMFDHILRLPFAFFRNAQSGLVVTSLVKELAAASDFIGMAVAVPVTNLLTLFAFAGYLLWLNPLLAVVSLSIYPIVLLIVPRLQKRVDRYNRRRVDVTRELSGKIGESVGGIHEIKVNGAYDIEGRRFGVLADRLKRIRIRWRLYRFSVKVINSLFTNLSRFLIFALGGYMALKGQLEIGSLVAFLSAQEKLYDPWKELLGLYQSFKTANVTYRQTMDFFDVPQDALHESDGFSDLIDTPDLAVENLSFVTQDDKALLRNISFEQAAGKHLALVGSSGSGKSTLAHCLVRLIPATGGTVQLGERRVSEMSSRGIARNIGFVSQSPLVFDGSIEDNLLYGCRAAGDDVPDLEMRIEVLHQVGLFVDVLDMGLGAVLDTEKDDGLRHDILDLRHRFRERCESEVTAHIERYDRERFLSHSSLLENILFGTPKPGPDALEKMMSADVFARTLAQTRLDEPLMELGIEIAENMLDIFDDAPSMALIAGDVPLESDEFDRYAEIVNRVEEKGIPDLAEPDRKALLALALRFVPARHKVVSLPGFLTDRILEAREMFSDKLSESASPGVSLYREDRYLGDKSILDNIIFGKVTSGSDRVVKRVNKCVNRLLVDEALLESILGIGMRFQVGNGGENLSGGQRQKIAIARALLKQPPVLILDEATANLDNASQARIQNVLGARLKGRSTVIAVIHRLDIIKDYDRIAVMDSGKIVEMGTYDELIRQEGMLHRLIHQGR